MSDQLVASDALLLGRATYEGFLTTWPSRSGDPIADRMNSLPKHVASTTLEEPLEWNATLLRGEVAEAVRELKRQPGQNLIVYGSGRLVHLLLQLDLVDVLQLMVVPLAVGSGRPFFRDGRDPTTLSLTDVKTTSRGVVMLTYERATNQRDRSDAAEEPAGDWWMRRSED